KPEEIVILLMREKGLSQARAEEIAAVASGSAGHAYAIADGGVHPLRTMTLEMLAAGQFPSYAALVAKAKEFADVIGARGKEVDEETRAEIYKGYPEKLTAVQKESLEKEIEGHVAL